MMPEFTLSGIAQYVGKELGVSSWVTVDQSRINQFAECSGDRQWIHVDVERAERESPYRAPIAHGYLTLSLLAPTTFEVVTRPLGVAQALNYGLDKVRFVSPVPVGSRIRMSGVIAEVTEVKGDGLQLTVDQTIEVEGASKPAVVARAVYRFYR